jgi:hypothetical protein
MRQAGIGQASRIALRAEPRIETLRGERTAALVGQKGERRWWARAGRNRLRKPRINLHAYLPRLTPSVLLLRINQPAVFDVLAAERNAIAVPRRKAEHEFEREPRHPEQPDQDAGKTMANRHGLSSLSSESAERIVRRDLVFKCLCNRRDNCTCGFEEPTARAGAVLMRATPILPTGLSYFGGAPNDE